MTKIRLVIEYDNDDAEQSMRDELKDWIEGHVDVRDCVVCADPDIAIRVEPLGEDGRVVDTVRWRPGL